MKPKTLKSRTLAPILCLLTATTPTRAATPDTSLCASIAEALQTGKKDHSDPDLDSIVPEKSWQELLTLNDDIIGTLRKAQASPDLINALKKFERDESNIDPGIVWLGHSGAGAIMDPGGHMGCARFLFFDTKGGPARLVPAPPGTKVDKMTGCAAAAPQLGLIGQAPVLIIHQPDDPQGTESIRVIPWQHGQWGPECRVYAKFSPATEQARGTIKSVRVTH